VDLFLAAFPNAQWPEILALRDQDTRKAKVFRRLLPGGWDFRTRVARLRDLKIPIESRSSQVGTACHEFRIPEMFLMAYEEMTRQRRTA